MGKLREGAKFDEVAREFSEDKARAGGGPPFPSPFPFPFPFLFFFFLSSLVSNFSSAFERERCRNRESSGEIMGMGTFRRGRNECLLIFSMCAVIEGGSLGWKVRGALDAAFEKAAYELEPSTVANPKFVEVKTGFGYHIIMVEGRR